ncbi:hypothetical protein RAS2_29690 [Phycisphaerae bacterium RAS2]|nr:hypothetical protein RAS2_29690 [Phycisphaerae bacterium RAS2]
MSPSRWAMSTRRAVLVAAIAGASAWTISASAHPIAVARGVAVIDGARVRITLREAGESLIHDMPALHARGDFAPQEIERAFARRAGNMVSRLEVRDESGRLLAGRLKDARFEPARGDAADRSSEVSWRGARATYELEYIAERSPTHVTLRQSPPEDAIIPTQFALRVQKRSDSAERFVRLTSAGNAETLDLSPSPPPDASQNVAGKQTCTVSVGAAASMFRHRFKCVQAVVRRETDRVLVDAYVPLTLLETWRPINREQADFVTPAEQRAACEAASDLLQKNVSVLLPKSDRRAFAPVSPWSAVLGPDAVHPCVGEVRPHGSALGAWSARVAVRLEFAVPPTESAITLDWRLFNPAVLTADLLIVSDATSSGMAEAMEHQVTTYNSTVVLKMPAATSPREPVARAIAP